MRYVIIGNSAAGVGAVEAIRQRDAEGAVTIISDEPHHTYSRPLISYLLGGLVDEARMAYRPPEFYEQNEVEAMLGTRVTRVHPVRHELALAGGGVVAYDQLLIATGGKPFVPPVPGGELDGVFTFTTWQDARQIGRYIERYGVQSALVIGGGLIGLKATEALMARDIDVTIVELADRILSTSFDQTASHLAESILRREGTEIRTGTTVEEIVGREERVDHALLQDGARIDCDIVLFAIGVRPNVDLVTPEEETGVRVGRGIIVDRQMRTTADDVYAAGDCVEAYDMLIDGKRPIAIWPNAYRQGAIAGANMAGGERAYGGGFPMNSVEVCGVPTIAVGLTDPQDEMGRIEILERYDREALTYKKLVLRGDRLVGAICVGEIDRVGIYTGLIRNRADVSPFKDTLLSGNFGLISLPKEYRKHMVTGEGIVV